MRARTQAQASYGLYSMVMAYIVMATMHARTGEAANQAELWPVWLWPTVYSSGLYGYGLYSYGNITCTHRQGGGSSRVMAYLVTACIVMATIHRRGSGSSRARGRRRPFKAAGLCTRIPAQPATRPRPPALSCELARSCNKHACTHACTHARGRARTHVRRYKSDDEDEDDDDVVASNAPTGGSRWGRKRS